MRRAVCSAAPRCPQRALRAREFHRLMMFKRAQRLRNDRISAARKVEKRAEIVLQLRMIGLLGVGRGVDRLRVAQRLEIPSGEVEEVDWLFKNPVSHTADVISPALRA